MAALCAFAAVGAASVLLLLLVGRNDLSSFYAVFGGWQLNAMAAALSAGLLTLVVVWVVVLVRMYRRLRGRTPNRRAVVMAVLLPGLFLGAMTEAPMRSALSWASQHTAAGEKAYAEFQQSLATNRAAPPTFSFGANPASPTLAALMVRPSDLGAGWYGSQRPNPSVTSGGVQGQLLGVRSMLGQWHWTGTMWSPDNLAQESLRRFATPAAAQVYLATFGQQPKNVPAPRLGPTTHTRVGSVLVYEDQEVGSIRLKSAAFIVGADEFFVSSSNVPAANFATLVEAAVRRATTGR